MRHSIDELEHLGKEARRTALEMIASLGKGHVGGALSIVDLLVVLYYEEMNVDPANPQMPGRDRLVLSKGHGGPGLYSILTMKGYFDRKEIYTLNKPGTILPSHCDRKLTPGIDMTTGSLGQGLSAAIGMALADRIDQNGAYTYCIIGDGESQEGQIWEAGMYAAQAGLSHLIAALDLNGQQIDGPVDSINSLRNAADKWRAFGWNVQEIDGHDYQQIYDAIEKAKRCTDRPNMLAMRTVKGKGWKRIEGTTASHSRPVTAEDLQEALRDLQ
ncbi:transketolase [Eubacteriales bacterium]|nr:transketolase [Faecalicatena sp. BF-R-105]GKH49415.1 transketolase [Eubacteriales bacterium]GKH62057.1 transketolase [Eubacteriales bacterium]